MTLVAAVALTGCGRDEGGGTAVKDAKAGKVSSGKATGSITVWALGAEGEKLGEIAAGFEKANPEAKVKVTVIPFDAAHDKIATAIAGSQTPGREPGRHHLAGGVLGHRGPRPDAYRPHRRAQCLLRGLVEHHRGRRHVVRCRPGTSRPA